MNVEIANKLVNLRKSSGLSQEALAEKIGVSRQAVSIWERAESSPDTDNLIALSKLYNVSLDEMLSTYDGLGSAGNEQNNQTPDAREKGEKKVPFLKLFPYPVFVAIVYFILGYVWGWWHPAWLVFLTIPLWGAVVSYITKKNSKDN